MTPANKETFVFRVDANDQIGFGHLGRTLALADALGRHGGVCHFLVHDDVKQVRDWLSPTKHQLYPLMKKDDLDELVKCANRSKCAHLIVDHYTLSKDYIAQARQAFQTVTVFDDMFLPACAHANTIINAAPLATREDYSFAGQDVTVLSGSAFTCLRKEILDAHPASCLDTVADRKSILLFMGGADPGGLTMPIAQALLSAMPGTTKILAPTTSPDLFDQLTRLAEKGQGRLKPVFNSENMGALINQCGYGVIAAGSILAEVGLLGVPVLAIITAKNQKPAMKMSKTFGWFECQEASQTSPAKIAEYIQKQWRDIDGRVAASNMATRLYPKDGADAIARKIYPSAKTPAPETAVGNS